MMMYKRINQPINYNHIDMANHCCESRSQFICLLVAIFLLTMGCTMMALGIVSQDKGQSEPSPAAMCFSGIIALITSVVIFVTCIFRIGNDSSKT